MARALGADLGNSGTIQSLGNGHYENSETSKVASQFAVHSVETADGISKLRELNDFTYPTRSSRFLDRMKPDTQNQSDGTYTAKASVPLKIIIAGAGLGGLATAIGLARTGHSVQIFEQAPALGEVGAGIQIPPNSTRILLKWGLGAHLAAHVVEPESINFRRWEDGSIIGLTKLIPDFRDSFDAPYFVVHRAHFHSAMYELAKELGVKVILDAKICNYDPESPALKLKNGEIHKADLVIAADGTRSMARKIILGNRDVAPSETGFAAYRATVDVEKMRADPDTAWLLEKPSLNIWIGDLRHVMSYTIAAGRSFNMVLSHPEKSDPKTWNTLTTIEDMKKQFEGWDYKLVKIINMVESALKWPLLSGQPLQRWVHESGKLLMLGDAAHAMVPYMSQGAAMAVEDAAALAAILAEVKNREEIHDALNVFERVRIVRSGQMQNASLTNGKLWHYADGPEQKARDSAMRHEVLGEHFIESPNQWSDPLTQAWCYGYDAEAEVLSEGRSSQGSGKA